MTDQTFQPGSGDPTQTSTTSTQGGVFGGFTAEDAAKQATQTPDHSELFTETAPAAEPVAPFGGDFPQFGPSEPETTEIQNPFAVETTPVVEEAVQTNPFVDSTPVVEEAVMPNPFSEVTPVEEIPVVEETPAPEVVPVEEIPVVEETPAPEVVPVEEIPVVEEAPAPEVAPVEEIPVVEEVPAPEVAPVSDFHAKYNELASNIDALLKDSNGQTPEIVGSNTDTARVDYRFNKEDTLLDITRVETSKEDPDDTNENTISFVYDEESDEVQVFLDDVLLYEEHELTDDSKKKMQVMEKINKFIFLTGEKMKDLEKARKAKEAEEAEKRRLQDIFRNF